MEGLIPYVYRAFIRYRKRRNYRNPSSSEMGSGKFGRDHKYYYYVRLQGELDMTDEQNHVAEHCLSWKHCKERRFGSMGEEDRNLGKQCTNGNKRIWHHVNSIN
ncbi:hypothetical protein SUGI_0498860 [Cryptomeria japonica]|nr:hypothetical protein SUGI_0498860 [Cryptomeria japonica]